MSTFSHRLKKIREQKNLSQKRVADALGISNVQLSRYETGDRKPDPETIASLADYFDVSVDYLLGLTDNPNPTKKRGDNSIEKITKILDEYKIENIFFYDLEAWENFTPDDIEELRKHFEWVAHKAKERNKGK